MMNSSSNRAKRPMNSFMIWQRSQRHMYNRKYPRLPQTEISRMLGEVWKAMSEAEKRPFRDEANRLRAAYFMHQFSEPQQSRHMVSSASAINSTPRFVPSESSAFSKIPSTGSSVYPEHLRQMSLSPTSCHYGSESTTIVDQITPSAANLSSMPNVIPSSAMANPADMGNLITPNNGANLSAMLDHTNPAIPYGVNFASMTNQIPHMTYPSETGYPIASYDATWTITTISPVCVYPVTFMYVPPFMSNPPSNVPPFYQPMSGRQEIPRPIPIKPSCPAPHLLSHHLNFQ